MGAGHHAHVVTAGAESKFGIHPAHIPELKKIAKKYGLRITGLHQHIGSGGIFKASMLLKVVDSFLEVARQFPDLEHIDFGGGFGVPYAPGEGRLPLIELGKKMHGRVKKFAHAYGRPIEMSFEPGRFVVAEAGVLLARVTDVKRNPQRTFIGVDSGMGHLIRPMMYGAYHEIENISHPHKKRERVTVAGYYCESGDVLAKDRLLPMPEIGDILAIKNAGAYGFVMSSDYNLRPKPREVMLE